MFTVDVVAGHGFMPVEVRVNTAAPVKAGGGVHVAFKVLAGKVYVCKTVGEALAAAVTELV